MTSNLSPSLTPSSKNNTNTNTNTNNIQLRYGYLLVRKNGTILPLVAIDDLPSTITVLPSLSIVNGMTLLEEIRSPRSQETPKTALSPPATQFAKRSASVVIQNTPESTPQNPKSVVQHHDQTFTLDLFSPYSQTSVTDRIRDVVQPRILFPNTFSQPPTESHTSASSPPPPPKNSRFYVHPHSQDEEPTPLSPQPIIPSLPITKSCPTYTPSDTCHCHDIQPTVKAGQFFTYRAGEDQSDGQIAEGESSSDEASSTYGGSSSISGEVEPESAMHQKARHPKIPKPTEPCAYFHRRIGCKRGKDCLYAHESTGKDKDGSTRLSGQALGMGPGNTQSKKNDTHASTASSRKLEGKWRRTENRKNKEVVAGDGDDNQVINDRKRLMTTQNLPTITCPTPGRTLSSTDPAKHIKTHCTFFLRFGECDYWPACKFSHEQPEGTSRWRGSKLPSSSKRTPDSKDFGGQGDEEEAANERRRRKRSVGKDVTTLTTITEKKRDSSIDVTGSSGSSSSCEDGEGDSDMWLGTAHGRKVREGQLISLFD